jgi:hypothetical protein
MAMALQTVAGAALGLLLGLLIGLSNSPVVAVVVGALASGLMVLLGFVPNKVAAADAGAGAAGVDALRAAGWRLAGFGFACSAALLAGMYIRTHEAMSPTPEAQMKRLTAAGFSADEARAWVAFKDAGLLFKTGGGTGPGGTAGGGETATVVDKEHSGANSGSSFLFAQAGVDNCRMFTEENYPSGDEELRALTAAGAPFKAMAEALRPLDGEKRAAALKVLRTVYCK